MDEQARAKRIARRGVTVAVFIPALFLAAILVAYYIWLYFYADFSLG
jgi:hypothetical protein